MIGRFFATLALAFIATPAFAQLPPPITPPATGSESITCYQSNVPKTCTSAQIAALAGTIGTQAANHVYAAPNGSSGTAAFRALVTADVPTGTSGPVIPLLSGLNTWASDQNITNKLYAGEINSGNSASNWIETLRPASTSISQGIIVNSGGYIGALAASRSSDNTCTGGCQGNIGIEGIVWNNNVTAGQIQSSYAGYLEATREAGAGTTHGLEVDTRNRGTLVSISPTSMFPTGATPTLWLASGAGQTGTAANSAAIGIAANGAKYDKGIVFDASSLVARSDTRYEAISLGQKQNITFYDSTGSIVGNIGNGINGAGLTTSMEFDGDAVRILNGAGGETIGFYGSGGEKIAAQPFSSLPTCNSSTSGTIAYVNDASAVITTWHQTVSAGGGSNKAFVTCNGSTWNAFSY